MIKNYSTFINERKVNLNCIDCGKHAEAFFVKNPIWYDNVPKTKRKGVMCISCLEKRMGRKLVKSDFQTGGTCDIHPDQPWWDSIQESKKYGTDYSLSKDDISELFVDFTDDNFILNIEYGFVNKNYEINDISTVEIMVYEYKDYFPAIAINLIRTRESKGNLTDNLQTVLDYLDYLEDIAEVAVYASGYTPRKYISIESGYFLVDDEEISDDYISIYLISNEVKELTQLEMAEYYDFKGYGVKGNNITIDIEMEDLADMTLSRNSDYKDYIKDNVDYDWYPSDYRPSLTDLFTQLLTDENADKLLDMMLKEYGSDYLAENDVTKEEIKNNIYYLSDLSNDMVDEILNMYADWEQQDHFYKNVKEAQNDFDSKLSDDFEFTKYKKKIEKSYMSGQEKKTYMDEVTMYSISFNNAFIERYDKGDIDGCDMYDLLKDFFYREIGYKLNPRFTDYGNVDYNKFNTEVKSMLK